MKIKHFRLVVWTAVARNTFTDFVFAFFTRGARPGGGGWGVGVYIRTDRQTYGIQTCRHTKQTDVRSRKYKFKYKIRKKKIWIWIYTYRAPKN